jgi:ACS family hexuronate transporter-like MFS transporter
MFSATAVGLILQYTGSYYSVFVAAASAYLIALLIIHLLAPKLEPAQVSYE